MRQRGYIAIGAALLTAAAVVATAPGVAAAQDPELVSVTGSGTPFEAPITWARVSEDGNVVGFIKDQADDGDMDVHARIRSAGTTKLLDDEPWVGADGSIAVSGDGRYLALVKDADDAYSYRIDVASGEKRHGPLWPIRGASSPSLSDGGGKLALIAYNFFQDGQPTNVYTFSHYTGKTTKVTFGTRVTNSVMSGDGTKVAYRAGGHAYVRTLATGATVMADVTPGGSAGNATNGKPVAFSDDGRYLLFTSSATNLAPGTGVCTQTTLGCVFRRKLADRVTVVASVLPNGTVTPAARGSAMSDDARVFAFDAVVDGSTQVYVRRHSPAVTRKASVNAAGQQADAAATHPQLTGDGSEVVFRSAASNFGVATGGVRQAWITAGGV